MDSILVAHVAEAIEDITGVSDGGDYDATADRAARMLGRSAVLREVAARYQRNRASGAELRAAVLGMLHGESGGAPFDVDSDDSPLMDAIGEVSPTTAANADERSRAVDAYRSVAGE